MRLYIHDLFLQINVFCRKYWAFGVLFSLDLFTITKTDHPIPHPLTFPHLDTSTQWDMLFTFNPLFSHPQLIRLAELSLLSSDDAPPLLSGRLQALLAGVSMRPLLPLRLLPTGLLPVQLFKRGFPGASPSVVSIPLILDGHGADRGRRRGRLSAVWQENPAPRAVFTVRVCT